MQLQEELVSTGNGSLILLADYPKIPSNGESTDRQNPRKKSTSLILTSSALSLQIETKEVNGHYAETIRVSINVPTTVEVIKSENGSSSWRKYRGILLALQSSLIFSITAILVKQLENHNPITIALWRYQGALWPGLLCFTYHRCLGTEKESIMDTIYPLTIPKRLKMFGFLVTRSILTCNALLLHFYCLKYLAASDALVISNSTPIFVMLFSHYFLKESCGVVPVIAAFLSCVGILIISRPPHLTGEEDFDLHTLWGLSLGLGSMLLASFSYIVLRSLRKVHYTITTVAFSTWGTFENSILAVVFGVFSLPENSQDWIVASSLILLTFIGQLSIVFATKCELASIVALVRTLDCILCFILQYMFLGIKPDLFSIFGSGIVIFAVFIITFKKYLLDLPPSHRGREIFFFLLK